jgi:hypothetical protein
MIYQYILPLPLVFSGLGQSGQFAKKSPKFWPKQQFFKIIALLLHTVEKIELHL